MKVIDLLNKIANDEEVPEKIRIEGWCYQFEWIEHLDNYYDKHADLDLMSVLSMDKEELNKKVKIIQEGNKIKKLHHCCQDTDDETLKFYETNINLLVDKVNEIIDKMEEIK